MILVTGGAGFIGSHTVVALMQAGHPVLVLDNLSNSDESVFANISKIVNQYPLFVKGDVRDKNILNTLFHDYPIDTVIHFAGLKSVNESIKMPLSYYDHNVQGTWQLLSAMKKAKVFKLVFSSSATIYGVPASVPIFENFPRQPINPYGRTKAIIEEMLMDLKNSNSQWKIISLRYFNPVGAHESGLIGENPTGVPNNLMPYLSQVAAGILPSLNVYGGDYPTKDGTGIRDYIHVMDLAEGHLAAMDYLQTQSNFLNINLGTGKGISVLEMINQYEKIIGRAIAYKIVERREGDVAECWADVNLAKTQLNWQAQRNLEAMCRDSWKWQSYCMQTNS